MPSRYKGTDAERQALDLFIKLARGSESYIRRLACGLDGTGLNLTQFGVMETLHHLGPLKPSQLAEKHLRSRNNLTVVVDQLERQGYVRRMPCPNDRRAQLIALTEEGTEKILLAMPAFVARVVRESSALEPEEQAELARLMKKLGTGRTP